jgi:hypothetical protein
MKASELIVALEKIIESNGDLDVTGAGHPGETWCDIDPENISVAGRDRPILIDGKYHRGGDPIIIIWF